jgi:hypothetical protein
MQAIATFLMLMLTIIEVGLSVIFTGVLAIGIYEAGILIWSRLEERESLAAVALVR